MPPERSHYYAANTKRSFCQKRGREKTGPAGGIRNRQPRHFCGIYAGAVGYLGFNGDMDLAIAIRTGIIKDGKLHVQAGAGIVADSVPQSEWIETQNKAKALLRAAEIAESGLDSKVE